MLASFDTHGGSGAWRAYKKFWGGCFRFRGRASRSEFWWSVLINFLIGILLLGFVFSEHDHEIFFEIEMRIFDAFSLATCLPYIAIAIRRLHDIGKSGWNYLWFLSPLVGLFYLFHFAEKMGWTWDRLMIAFSIGGPLYFVYLLFRPSQSGVNRYGEPEPL